jgi:hypothetical protein
MSPRQLLDTASGLLTQPSPSMRRCWPRACASLTRVALEQALREYWQWKASSLVGRPMRHQLLALLVFADTEIAAISLSARHGLSRAVHHHTYELPPTAAELEGWNHDVATLLARLARKVDHVQGPQIFRGGARNGSWTTWPERNPARRNGPG